MNDDDANAVGHAPPRLERLNSIELTPRRLEMRRLAAAGRAVIEHLVTTDASLEELSNAADELEEVATTLRSLPSGASYNGFSEVANAGAAFGEHGRSLVADTTGDADPGAYASFDHSPFIGLANPLSPPIVFDYDPDRITGRVTFGSAYEGPPGCVHGGYIAAAFDELLGAAQSLSGTQGMTARLTVNYRSPTPLHQELRLEAHLDRTEGRKIFCEGSCWVGDRLCAESEGLFISMDPSKFQALLADRLNRLGS
jgi:acyl-coenzyme A thioesterase PaaI-like protein